MRLLEVGGYWKTTTKKKTFNLTEASHCDIHHHYYILDASVHLMENYYEILYIHH